MTGTAKALKIGLNPTARNPSNVSQGNIIPSLSLSKNWIINRSENQCKTIVFRLVGNSYLGVELQHSHIFSLIFDRAVWMSFIGGDAHSWSTWIRKPQFRGGTLAGNGNRGKGGGRHCAFAFNWEKRKSLRCKLA